MVRDRILWVLVAVVAVAGCGGREDEGADRLGVPTSSAKASASSEAWGSAESASVNAIKVAASIADEDTVVRPPAPSPFSRRYRIFAANGAPYALDLDFANRRYQFSVAGAAAFPALPPTAGTPLAGAFAAGLFTVDSAQPGTFVFQRQVSAVVSVARFRLIGNAVIGTFPLAQSTSDGVVGVAYPFIGVGDLVLPRAELDGVYNRATYATPFQDAPYSLVHQVRISDGGTKLQICRSDTAIYRMENCPSALVRTYTIASGQQPGVWHLDTADASEKLDFSIAKVNGQNVYLAAGRLSSLDRLFRIGLPDSAAWTQANMYGAFTAMPPDGSNPAFMYGDAWTQTRVETDSIRQSAVYASGAWVVERRPLASLPTTAPSSMRSLQSGSSTLYSMRGAGLWAMVAIPRAGTVEPYRNAVLLGLWGSAEGGFTDPRNDTYTVFAANGTKQQLRLDFDHHTYEMTDAAGHSASGEFSADPIRKDVYIFATDLVSPAPGARFQVTIDAVVGAFPFLTSSNPSTYAVQPFIAARTLVDDSSGFHLVGSLPRFNAFSIQTGEGTNDSKTTTFDLLRTADSVELGVCSDDPLKPMCTASERYTVTHAAQPGTWTATNMANPNDKWDFHVARIGGRNVFLRSTRSGGSSPVATFQVGLTSWAAAVAWPGTAPPTAFPLTVSTLGWYGSSSLLTNSIGSAFTRPDGSSASLSVNLEPVTAYPTARRHESGIRIGWNVNVPTDEYDATSDGSIMMVLGRPGNPNTEGYWQITMGGWRLSDPAP